MSTNIVLLHVIRKSFGTGVVELIRQSPRLGILLAAICIAIIFTIADICASIIPSMSLTDGYVPKLFEVNGLLTSTGLTRTGNCRSSSSA